MNCSFHAQTGSSVHHPGQFDSSSHGKGWLHSVGLNLFCMQMTNHKPIWWGFVTHLCLHVSVHSHYSAMERLFCKQLKANIVSFPEAEGWEAVYLLYYQKARSNFTKKTFIDSTLGKFARLGSGLLKICTRKTGANVTTPWVHLASNDLTNSRKSSEGYDVDVGVSVRTSKTP